MRTAGYLSGSSRRSRPNAGRCHRVGTTTLGTWARSARRPLTSWTRSRRGLPWSAAALAMAVTLVDDELDRDAGTDKLQTLAALKQRLEALSRSARSSGGFCSVFTDLEDIGLLEPAPRAKAPQGAPAVARA